MPTGQISWAYELGKQAAEKQTLEKEALGPLLAIPAMLGTGWLFGKGMDFLGRMGKAFLRGQPEAARSAKSWGRVASGVSASPRGMAVARPMPTSMPRPLVAGMTGLAQTPKLASVMEKDAQLGWLLAQLARGAGWAGKKLLTRGASGATQLGRAAASTGRGAQTAAGGLQRGAKFLASKPLAEEAALGAGFGLLGRQEGQGYLSAVSAGALPMMGFGAAWRGVAPSAGRLWGRFKGRLPRSRASFLAPAVAPTGTLASFLARAS